LRKEPELFNSIVICPDQELSRRLEKALAETEHVNIVRVIDRYPGGVEVLRSLRAQAAEILFLSFESVAEALDTVKAIEAEAGSVQVVAIHQRLDPAVLRESMRSGIREFLVDPFDPHAVKESLSHIKGLLEPRPASYESTNEVYSFLPSKAGAGASTLVLNVQRGARAQAWNQRAALRLRSQFRDDAVHDEAGQLILGDGCDRKLFQDGRPAVASTGFEVRTVGSIERRPCQSKLPD
jgi:hypothetical protein